MATVNYLYRSLRENSNLNVRLLYSYDGKDYVYGANTKFEISKKYWNEHHVIDKKTKKIKGTKDVEIINKRLAVETKLNKIRTYILKSFNDTNPNDINKEWLQKQIDNCENPQNENKTIPTELTKYIDFYIDYRKHELKQTSIQKFKVIKSKILKIENIRKNIILIKDVNDNFKNDFVNFYKSENYAQNTIQRELTFIKTVCRHARFLGLETHPQLDSLRLDSVKVEKIYLTFKELATIEKTKLTESLENVKDWLLISCYCGQRVSDFLRFSNNMIRVEDEKSFIEFTQKKTDKIMTIPLHPKIIEILQKRNGLFPAAISDQKYNDYVKKVCEIAGLTQMIVGSKHLETTPNSGIFRKEIGMYRKCDLITSHIGRRSFATNFYGIIPTSLLINITGHSTESLYLLYVGKSNKDLAKETFKYFT